jgi:hypothetical protein
MAWRRRNWETIEQGSLSTARQSRASWRWRPPSWGYAPSSSRSKRTIDQGTPVFLCGKLLAEKAERGTVIICARCKTRNVC